MTVNENLNPGWQFIKADPAGAQLPECDDSKWETVSTPHTFNDVDTFIHWSTPNHVGELDQWSGRTWYRKSFLAPEDWRKRKVVLKTEVAELFAAGEAKLLKLSGKLLNPKRWEPNYPYLYSVRLTLAVR